MIISHPCCAIQGAVIARRFSRIPGAPRSLPGAPRSLPGTPRSSPGAFKEQPRSHPRHPAPRSHPRPRELLFLFSCGPHIQSASGSRAVMRACCVWSGGACWLSPGVVWAAAVQELPRSIPGVSDEPSRRFPRPFAHSSLFCMCVHVRSL